MNNNPTLSSPPQPLPIETLGTPVASLTRYATAISPNTDGTYTFIANFYLFPSSVPPIYVLVNLDPRDRTPPPAAATISPAPPLPEGAYGYTNDRYQWDRQVRAANGRIFFAEWGGQVRYFDPAGDLHSIGVVSDPCHDVGVFTFAFDREGFLYGGTQTKSNDALPLIVRIDPNVRDPRQQVAFATVGRVTGSQQIYSYAYTMAVDPPWVYVGLGESPWQLTAINIDTRLLADPDGPHAGANPGLELPRNVKYISLDPLLQPEIGIVVKFQYPVNGQPTDKTYWCADGQIYNYIEGRTQNLPFLARDVRPRTGANDYDAIRLDTDALTPQGDARDTSGTSTVKWRLPSDPPDLSSTAISFTVPITPVPIESLLALTDGTLLGNASDYNGFFRHYPVQGRTDHYGTWRGVSRGPRVSWNSHVFIAGYPQSRLYEYDPSFPWGRENPKLLGQFRNDDRDNPPNSGFSTGTHYANFLIPGPNDRLYFVGTVDRTAGAPGAPTGSGIGFYQRGANSTDPGVFYGHHRNLAHLDPEGFVVLPESGRLVFSGKLIPGVLENGQPATVAKLVIYDLDLQEVDRRIVDVGQPLQNTGVLFTVLREPNHFIGLVGQHRLVYRYDINQQLLRWRSLEAADGPLQGSIVPTAVHPTDGAVWAIIGGKLIRIDPRDLKVEERFTVPAGTTLIEWQGDTLYLAMRGSGELNGVELGRAAIV